MRGREGYRRGSSSRAANISTALTGDYSWAEDGGVRREKGGQREWWQVALGEKQCGSRERD